MKNTSIIKALEDKLELKILERQRIESVVRGLELSISSFKEEEPIEKNLVTNLNDDDLSNLTVAKSAVAVLKENSTGLTTRQIMKKFAEKGKLMRGKHPLPVINSDLKRFPEQFKKTNGKWFLKQNERPI